MVNKYIVVNVSLFGANTIYEYTTEGESTKLKESSVDELSKDIVGLCYSKGIADVQLFGNDLFLKPIVKKINRENEKCYSKKLDIKVKVN